MAEALCFRPPERVLARDAGRRRQIENRRTLRAQRRALKICRQERSFFGSGPNVSMWDGPPSIIKKQFFAFAGRRPGFGASGPAAAAVVAPRRSPASSELSAPLPMLALGLWRKSRRVGARSARCPAQGNGFMAKRPQ